MSEDLINNPSHYHNEAVTFTVEPIELCEQCGFLFGNGLKYLFRYKNKGNPRQDLLKAQYYFKRYQNSLNNGTSLIDCSMYDYNSIPEKAFRHKDFLKRIVKEDFYKPDNIGEKFLQFIDEELKKYPEPEEKPRIPEVKESQISYINLPKGVSPSLELLSNLQNFFMEYLPVGYNCHFNNKAELYGNLSFITGSFESDNKDIRFRIYYTNDTSKPVSFYTVNAKDYNDVKATDMTEAFYQDSDFLSWFSKVFK